MKPFKIEDAAAFLKAMIQRAGDMALDYRKNLDQLKVENKESDKDLVTEADRQIEHFIIREILNQFSNHSIFGEESGEQGHSEYRWIIDPIDGTGSFVRGQPFFSVSIALEIDGDLELGAVYAPALGELFTARKNGGAYCGEKKLKVSTKTQLSECMLATGFACVREHLKHNNIPYFNAMMPQVQDCRRFGSAAIDLAYVAAGRLDGFWERNLNLYDVAAGMLLVTEAGGQVSDYEGGQSGLVQEIAVSNSLIHSKMIAVLSEVKRSIGSS